MRNSLLIVLFITTPFLSIAQFENVATKTIDKMVANINKDTTLASTKTRNGDTTIGYMRRDGQTHKVIEMIKNDTFRIKRNFYFYKGELIYILESKKQKVKGRPSLALFSISYYAKGLRIYNTITLHNRTADKILLSTKDIYSIGQHYYSKTL